MEPSFSFEAEPFDTLDNLGLVLQGLVCNVWKLVEKFEEFLKTLGSLLMPQKGLTRQTNGSGDSLESPSIGGLHDIAGLKNIKNILCTLVILPRQQPQLFANRKITNSILLYGPPGTGKTRLVHGLAAESGAKLHAISMGTILSSLVGETEKNIKRTFNCLRTNEELAILFIDEIDGLCRKRSSTEHDYSRRIKTELMCQMTKTDLCHNTIIIAATNCPWDLDSAILRRFQKRIYVPLPDSEERLELFQLLTKNIPIIQTSEQSAELIEMSEGFSGSDISGLVQDALDVPLTELQSTMLWNKTIDGFYEPFISSDTLLTHTENICIDELRNLPSSSVRARPVTISDFLEAARHIQVTVTAKDLDQYEKFRQSK